jgi:hypothetical protein
MNPDEERVVEVLDKALRQTKAKKLTWASTKDKPSENFFADVGKSQLQVAGKVDSGPYTLWLLNSSGKILGQLGTTPPLLARFGSDPVANWESKVEELWALARRQALAIDEEFDELLEALDGE